MRAKDQVQRLQRAIHAEGVLLPRRYDREAPWGPDEPRQAPASLPLDPGAPPQTECEDSGGPVMPVEVGQPPLEDHGMADGPESRRGRGHDLHTLRPAQWSGSFGRNGHSVGVRHGCQAHFALRHGVLLRPSTTTRFHSIMRHLRPGLSKKLEKRDNHAVVQERKDRREPRGRRMKGCQPPRPQGTDRSAGNDVSRSGPATRKAAAWAARDAACPHRTYTHRTTDLRRGFTSG